MMMHDEAWELVLLSYVDGDLEPARRAEVEAHLAGCAACQAEVAAVRASLGLVEPVTLAEPSAGAFLAGVERRAARAAVILRPEPRRRWWSALLDRDQLEPVRWFLFGLPALGALLFPDLRAVGVAATSLALGAILEYLMLTREGTVHDSH